MTDTTDKGMGNMRRLTIMLLTVGALLWAGSTIALGGDGFDVIDCTISGDQVPGTKIVFPELNAGWLVEIDRNGETLTSDGRATGYAFARDGEPYRGYHDGALVLSGVGNGFDCAAETTTTASVTTTTASVTTTTLPQACDDVECPPPTTTEPPSVTTTTQPGIPQRGADCPQGQHAIGETDDGRKLCAADAEGG